MKVSELVQDIVSEAELKFGHSEHCNDCINVGIYYSPEGTWQVWLDRPTQRQLDNGEVSEANTIKVSEYRCEFFQQAQDLVTALLQLQEAVDMADSWDFQA